MTSMTEKMNDAKDRAFNSAHHAASASRQELNDFFDDVQELVGHASQVADVDTAKIRSKVESSLHSARIAAGQTARQLQDRVTDAAASTDDYVRARPWTMIGIAAVVGLAVGVALQRR